MELITEADPKPDLVVVDAWLDTVPASLQVKDPQQARIALHPWKDAATTLDAGAAAAVPHQPGRFRPMPATATAPPSRCGRRPG